MPLPHPMMECIRACDRRERRLAGDLCPQRRRQRVVAEFQHGHGRRHRASRGEAVHSPAREAHRLHPESRIYRRRCPLGFRNRGSRGRTSGTGRRAVSEPEFGQNEVRGERDATTVSRASSMQSRVQQYIGDRPNGRSRLGNAHVVLRQGDYPSESGAAERTGSVDQSRSGRNALAEPGANRSAVAVARRLRFGALAAAGSGIFPGSLSPTTLREIPLEASPATTGL